MEDDFLKSLYNKHVLNASSILSLVDDFTIFCHYLGFQPEIYQKYRSPLRADDTNESFTLFIGPKEKTYFKDFGTGARGDVFDFIQKLYNISFSETLNLVNKDFALGIGGDKPVKDIVVPKLVPVIRPRKELRITSREGFSEQGLAFWRQFHIRPETLSLYNVTQVTHVHYDEDSIRPRGLAFAYRIGSYYKIYQPFSERFKFTSSFPREYVEGMMQLKYNSDTLIITKSLKDVMCLREVGFEAVSPKSENTPIMPHILKKLENHYRRIYVLFDNDNAGKIGAQDYPYRRIFLTKAKDVSDHIRDYGIMDTRLEITKLLYK